MPTIAVHHDQGGRHLRLSTRDLRTSHEEMFGALQAIIDEHRLFGPFQLGFGLDSLTIDVTPQLYDAFLRAQLPWLYGSGMQRIHLTAPDRVDLSVPEMPFDARIAITSPRKGSLLGFEDLTPIAHPLCEHICSALAAFPAVRYFISVDTALPIPAMNLLALAGPIASTTAFGAYYAMPSTERVMLLGALGALATMFLNVTLLPTAEVDILWMSALQWLAAEVGAIAGITGVVQWINRGRFPGMTDIHFLGPDFSTPILDIERTYHPGLARFVTHTTYAPDAVQLAGSLEQGWRTIGHGTIAAR